MAEMLDVARGGAPRMSLMRGGNLSLRQLNTFLDLLIENGMLQEGEGEGDTPKAISGYEAKSLQKQYQPTGKFYTTQKGLSFLEKFKAIKEFLFSTREPTRLSKLRTR